MPAECLPTRFVHVHAMLQHGGTALAQPVHVNNCTDIIDGIVGRQFGGFPDRTLGRLSVAHQNVNALVALFQARVEGDADADWQSLSQRSSGDVHIGQPGRGMTFEIGIELAQGQQMLARKQSGFRPRRIEDRSSVPL
jgi:hypothetical protein